LPKQVTPQKLLVALDRLGFKRTRVTGSHHRFAHPDGRKTTIPIHGNEPIGPGLLNRIIKQDLKIGKADFLKLLE